MGAILICMLFLCIGVYEIKISITAMQGQVNTVQLQTATKKPIIVVKKRHIEKQLKLLPKGIN